MTLSGRVWNLSDSKLWKVANKIHPNSLFAVGMELQIPEYRISHIEQGNPQWPACRRSYTMLKIWRDKIRRISSTCDIEEEKLKLTNVLLETSNKEAADELNSFNHEVDEHSVVFYNNPDERATGLQSISTDSQTTGVVQTQAPAYSIYAPPSSGSFINTPQSLMNILLTAALGLLTFNLYVMRTAR